MAQQLRRQGHEVGHLLLLDIASQPGTNLIRAFRDDAEQLLDLVRLEMAQQGTQADLSLHAVEHQGPEERLRYLMDQLVRVGRIPPEIEPSHVHDFLEGGRRRMQSVVDYRFGPYPGSVTLIRAAEGAPPIEGTDIDPADATLGFGRLSADVRVIFVPEADHFNLMDAPHVERLAAIMRKCLEGRESSGEPVRSAIVGA
jgi:thioesterase domain-containing protein